MMRSTIAAASITLGSAYSIHQNTHKNAAEEAGPNVDVVANVDVNSQGGQFDPDLSLKVCLQIAADEVFFEFLSYNKNTKTCCFDAGNKGKRNCGIVNMTKLQRVHPVHEIRAVPQDGLNPYHDGICNQTNYQDQYNCKGCQKVNTWLDVPRVYHAYQSPEIDGDFNCCAVIDHMEFYYTDCMNAHVSEFNEVPNPHVAVAVNVNAPKPPVDVNVDVNADRGPVETDVNVHTGESQSGGHTNQLGGTAVGSHQNPECEECMDTPFMDCPDSCFEA